MLHKTLRNAFTMIELIFVIIVIGILATIAIPKFSGVSEQAVIASGRSDVMSIRTAISTERQKRFMKGDSSYISHLDGLAATSSVNGDMLFDNNGTTANKLLTYGITSKSSNGGWMKTNTDEYTYYVSGTPNVFYYTAADGNFSCISGSGYCDKLTK
ncbi:MAG: type II secretion system protein [Thiovulaceae bacterium]|nr:type II secretion system protein [Sulfurimonadaceae bacterium]